MPIKPENKKRYPKNWKEIRERKLLEAGNCCQGSPDFPDCKAANYESHPVTGSKVILTIGHLDHQPENCDDKNLRAWCQRCHLNYDKEHHAINAAITRRAKSSQVDWLDTVAE